MTQTPENQQQYGSILTILGENAEQNGKLQNKQITFTHIAIGDANDQYVQPDRKNNTLVNELFRIPVNSVDVLQPTPDSVPMLKVEAILPDDVNDLVIREFAAVATFNGSSYFHAIGNCARIYVPSPVNNGNVSTPVTLEMIFVITSAIPIVEIDPNVITASRDYVNKLASKQISSSEKITEIDLSAFDRVTTLGFYAEGDGGGGEFVRNGNGLQFILDKAGNRWCRVANGAINYRSFGAKPGDMAFDSLPAIRMAHEFANNNNLPVSEHGNFFVDFTSAYTPGVIVETNSDLGRVRLVVSGEPVSSPYSTTNTIYKVNQDYDAVYQSDVLNKAEFSKHKRKITLPEDFNHAFVAVKSSQLDMIRMLNGGVPSPQVKGDVNYIGSKGKLKHCWERDFDSGDYTVHIKRILGAMKFYAPDFELINGHINTLVLVTRTNTEVATSSVEQQEGARALNGVLHKDTYGFRATHPSSNGLGVSGGDNGYDLIGSYSMKITYDGALMSEGWRDIDGNYCKDIYITGCSLATVGGHWHNYNITIENSQCDNVYVCGGGYLRLNNTSVSGSVGNRSDYVEFDGDIIIDGMSYDVGDDNNRDLVRLTVPNAMFKENLTGVRYLEPADVGVTWWSNDGSTWTLTTSADGADRLGTAGSSRQVRYTATDELGSNLVDWKLWDFGRELKLPNKIKINNVTVKGAVDGRLMTIYPVSIASTLGAPVSIEGRVRFPTKIDVSDITYESRDSHVLQISFEKVTIHATSPDYINESRLNVSNVRSENVAPYFRTYDTTLHSKTVVVGRDIGNAGFLLHKGSNNHKSWSFIDSEIISVDTRSAETSSDLLVKLSNCVIDVTKKYLKGWSGLNVERLTNEKGFDYLSFQVGNLIPGYGDFFNAGGFLAEDCIFVSHGVSYLLYRTNGLSYGFDIRMWKYDSCQIEKNMAIIVDTVGFESKGQLSFYESQNYHNIGFEDLSTPTPGSLSHYDHSRV